MSCHALFWVSFFFLWDFWPFVQKVETVISWQLKQGEVGSSRRRELSDCDLKQNRGCLNSINIYLWCVNHTSFITSFNRSYWYPCLRENKTEVYGAPQ